MLLCQGDAVQFWAALILVSNGSIEHAFQNRRLPNRRLVLRRLLHGRRLGDCRMARRAGLLSDLSTSGEASLLFHDAG